MGHKIDVLYVHPGGNETDYNIPVGLIGLMNSINCVKIGKMYFEVTDDLISRSRIIVMDCHWYFSLSQIGGLAKNFKKTNPAVIIVIGGYTASVFAENIINTFEVDYVIKGDAEAPFPLLIRELLEGRDGRRIPNIVNKRFVTPQSYCSTSRDISNTDYISIDWFPQLERRMRRVHQLVELNYTETLGYYPLIPVYKGCKYNCEFCYTKQTLYRGIYKRDFVLRTPESIIKDLLFCSRHKYIRQVYMIADFINVASRDFSEKIFSQKYNVNLYYDFEHFNSPSLPMLAKILNCFNECHFSFIFGEPFHTDLEARFNYLSEVLDYFRKTDKKVYVRIDCGGSKKSMQYCQKLRRQYEELMLGSYKQWFIPIPRIGKRKGAAKTSYFRYWIRKSKRDSESSFFVRVPEDDEYALNSSLGKWFFSRKKYYRAMCYWRKALSFGLNKGIVYFRLAEACLRLKRFGDAIKNAKKAVKLNHKEYEPYFLLGCCYEETRQYRKAIIEYRKAENINQKQSKVNFRLSDCYKNINRTEQAGIELGKAVIKFKKFK